jgi:predicted nucleic acid-binding protein
VSPAIKAVIATAHASRPCLAIIEEKRGRRIAGRIVGPAIKGTARILAEACRRGLLLDLRGTLCQLRRDGHFFAGAAIEAACKAVDSP